MVITTHHPARTLKHRFRTPALVIIELILEQLPQVGTAGHLLHSSLLQHYMASPSLLCYKRVPFDIGGAGAMGTHSIQMAGLVKELRQG